MSFLVLNLPKTPQQLIVAISDALLRKEAMKDVLGPRLLHSQPLLRTKINTCWMFQTPQAFFQPLSQ